MGYRVSQAWMVWTGAYYHEPFQLLLERMSGSVWPQLLWESRSRRRVDLPTPFWTTAGGE